MFMFLKLAIYVFIMSPVSVNYLNVYVTVKSSFSKVLDSARSQRALTGIVLVELVIDHST